MINTFDDMVIGLSNVIDNTSPLLRNKKLFCDAMEGLHRVDITRNEVLILINELTAFIE